MAAPNILSNTTMAAGSIGVALTTLLSTSIVANAAASGTSVKVTYCNVTNKSASSVNLTVDVTDGVTTWNVLNTFALGAGTAITVFDHLRQQVLAEGWSLKMTASTINALDVTGTKETWS